MRGHWSSRSRCSLWPDNGDGQLFAGCVGYGVGGAATTGGGLTAPDGDELVDGVEDGLSFVFCFGFLALIS